MRLYWEHMPDAGRYDAIRVGPLCVAVWHGEGTWGRYWLAQCHVGKRNLSAWSRWRLSAILKAVWYICQNGIRLRQRLTGIMGTGG